MLSQAGLDVVTDGEMRRLSFQSQLPAAVEGFGEWDLDAFLWGEWHSDQLDDMQVDRPPIAVVGTLKRKRFLSAEEFTYTRGRTNRIVKVTLPGQRLRFARQANLVGMGRKGTKRWLRSCPEDGGRSLK